MSAYRYVICDVFSNRPLAGNQLAVFPDGFEIPESRLREKRLEMRAGPAEEVAAVARVRGDAPLGRRGTGRSFGEEVLWICRLIDGLRPSGRFCWSVVAMPCAR